MADKELWFAVGLTLGIMVGVGGAVVFDLNKGGTKFTEFARDEQGKVTEIMEKVD